MIDNLVKYIKKISIDGIEHINSNSNIILKNDISKYSSSKEPSLKLEIDGLKLKRNDKVTYECPKCHIHSTIGVGRFLNKKSEYCYKCKEQDPEKRKIHSDYIKKSYSEYQKVVSLNKKEKKIDNIDELSIFSIKSFDEESDDFKKKYYERTPNLDDFNKIKDNIVSISNIDIINKDIKYYPIIKNTNQMKYSPKVLIGDKLVLFSNCKFICNLCDEIFVGRNIKKKAKSEIMCPSCSFSNKTFSFKTFKNIDGEKVVYQSIPELDLLKYCNKKNISIKNGPKIKYHFNNSEKIYKVDFEITKLSMLIEIKDNHVWHQNQVKSGKWMAKESSAKKWCEHNKYEYYLIFKIVDITKIIDSMVNEKFIKSFNNFKRV